MGYKDMRDGLKKSSGNILVPIIALLNTLGLSPNIVTIIGLLINIAAAFFIAKGMFITAGILVLFAGIFDMLDGALARKMGKKTKFGGFFDSTTDRLSEGAVYLGLLVYYLNTGDKHMAEISYVVMFLSFFISYIRARAGGLNIDCEEGILTRPERVAILILGLLLSRLFNSISFALIIIGIGSLVTVIQRFIIVYIRAKQPGKPKRK
jgi:CDP-diacylglycerol---glycerol-3-phosphate 3-phosphatidyltransferase